MDVEVYPTPDRRQADLTSDPEMVEGRGKPKKANVYLHFVGGGVAREDSNRRDDRALADEKRQLEARNWHSTVMFAKLRDGGSIPLRIFHK